MLMPSLLNDNFDLFDHFYDPWFNGEKQLQDMEKKLYGHHAKNVMRTDIKETDAGYEMEIDLPGFKKEEVKVELEDGYLTVSASKGFENKEAKTEKEAENGHYIRRERYSGACQRSFYVGNAINEEDVKARFEHGILTLDIPKKNPEELEKKNYIAIEG